MALWKHYFLMMRGLNNYLQFIIVLLCISFYAQGQFDSNENDRDQSEPFNIGQQIIVEKRQWTLQEQIFYFQFDHSSFILSRSRLAYGFSDTLGIEVSVPYFFNVKSFNDKTHGFGDVRILGQLNYYRTEEHLATFITGFEAPTGSTNKRPALGFGSTSYIAEFGFIHSSEDWYADWFVRGFKRRKKNDIDHGSEVRFRTSIGPKIHFGRKVKSDLFTLIQLRSIYENQTKIADIKDLNSGGFESVLGPLVSWRQDDKLVEATFEFPITQRLNGIQDHLQWIGSLTLQIDF